MKNKHSEVPEMTERYVQQLQDELAAATERSRLAKRAVKDAKAEAKIAKRDKKQARKTLIAAQAALEEVVVPATTEGIVTELTAATHERIPDSPEITRQRRRGSRPKKAAADAADTSSPAETTEPAPATLEK